MRNTQHSTPILHIYRLFGPYCTITMRGGIFVNNATNINGSNTILFLSFFFCFPPFSFAHQARHPFFSPSFAPRTSHASFLFFFPYLLICITIFFSFFFSLIFLFYNNIIMYLSFFFFFNWI